MLVGYIIAVLCENHNNVINTLFSQSAERLSLKQMEHISCHVKREYRFCIIYFGTPYVSCCITIWCAWLSAYVEGASVALEGDMEIVNEAKLYTLHPFAVQSEVQIEDPGKNNSVM